MRKKILSMMCVMGVLLGNVVSVQATSGSIQSQEIPVSAEPGSVLEYTSEGTWEKVYQSQSVRDEQDDREEEVGLASSQIVESDFSDMSIISREEEDAIIEQVDREMEKYPVYQEELPLPTIGMQVIYDNWGNVDEIYTLNDDGTYTEAERVWVEVKAADDSLVNTPVVMSALPKGTRKPAGTYTYGSVVDKTKNVVGYTTNTIVISEDRVIGRGDFTVFTDSEGDHGNTLVKGDCATKGDTDNPASGTKIRTRNMLNDKFAYFYKNDNGNLPNAVLDIWKTGVTKLGITSTNYSQIKFAGRYMYKF